jgi:hypothetical protein
MVQVFKGWDARSLSRVSPTDEYASFDVNVRMHERRQAIESGWIAELIAIGCSC